MSLPIEKIVLGSRKSRLARWQTDYIADLLRAAWPGLVCEVRYFVTQGDKTLDKPLPAIGGKGLFTLELEESLRAGEIDLAVHSLKDLPIADAPDLVLGAIVGRADVRDVLVTAGEGDLAALPTGALVGTSSRRRGAQLLRQRPDLRVESIRGNVETRIKKVMAGEYDATILAAAGVDRLGIVAGIGARLSLAEMLPAPGQGALAVQCRADDVAVNTLLAAIEGAEVRAAVTAERAFLQGLGGGCSAPVAAYATWVGGKLSLQAWVGAVDGTAEVAVAGKGDEPWSLGNGLAQVALAQGAGVYMEVSEVGEERPLRGQRVVVTRPLPGATRLSQGLAAVGAAPVVVPLIETRPLVGTAQVAVAQLADCDWLVFTSANGVRYFGEMVGDSKAWRTGRFRIAAVGEATAVALGAWGRAADVVPETFVGVAIAEVMGAVEGQRVLLPRAAVAGGDLVKALVAKGAVVTDLPIYETVARVPAAPWEKVAAITFASPSAVHSLVAAAGADLSAWVGEAQIVCIGPVTATAATAAGLRVAAVADPHTTAGLVAAVTMILKERE